jgi:hypothetical protein
MDQRFTVESSIKTTPNLQIQEARDNQLGRSVILVRMAPVPQRETMFALLMAAAAHGGTHLQRVLSLDRNKGQAVLQCLSGETLGAHAQGHRVLSPWEMARQIGLGLAALHQQGITHGGLSAQSIYLWDDWVIVDLISALSPLPQGPPSVDIDAILTLLKLAVPEPLVDGKALADWAHKTQVTQKEQQQKQQRDRVIEEALKRMPQGKS